MVGIPKKDFGVNKYCLIVTGGWSYLHGLNIVLNGLDYYDNIDLDVWIISTEECKDYLEYIKTKGFRFNIKTILVNDLVGDDLTGDAMCIYGRYILLKRISNDYDAIGIIDSDCMVLDNLIIYLDVVANNSLILCPQHYYERYWKEDAKILKDDYVQTTNNPLRNYPIFFCPKYHLDLINYLYDNRCNINATVDTYFFTSGLYKFNKLDKVLVLPASLWMGEHYLHYFPLSESEHGGKRYLISTLGDKIHILHNKFWRPEFVKFEYETLKGLPEEMVNTAKNNFDVILSFLDFFANKWKTNCKEILQLNSIYKETIFI